MCEYCEKVHSKEIINDNRLSLYVCQNQIVIAVEESNCLVTKINFCPMCGQRLYQPAGPYDYSDREIQLISFWEDCDGTL